MLDNLLEDAFGPLGADDHVVRLGDASGSCSSTPARADLEIVVPASSDSAPSFRHRLGPAVAKWCYRDGSGGVLGWVCRFEAPGLRKQILPYTLWRERGELLWRWSQWPDPRPLYGLDRLTDRPKAPVLIVEGEKCADAAAAVLGEYVVVTSSGCCKAAAKTDWSPLLGREVLIWPDADDEGLKYAEEVARLLEGVAVDIRLIDAITLAETGPLASRLEHRNRLQRLGLIGRKVSQVARRVLGPFPDGNLVRCYVRCYVTLGNQAAEAGSSARSLKMLVSALGLEPGTY